MARRRVNHLRIKVHYSYTVGEVADLLEVHRHTVRNWLVAGLPTVEGSRPILVAGEDLRTFLAGRRRARKQPLRHGQLYCLACRAPTRPDGNLVDYIPLTPASGNLRGFCPTCGHLIHRAVRRDRLGRIAAGLDVAFPQASPRIEGKSDASSNCASEGCGDGDET